MLTQLSLYTQASYCRHCMRAFDKLRRSGLCKACDKVYAVLYVEREPSPPSLPAPARRLPPPSRDPEQRLDRVAELARRFDAGQELWGADAYGG